LFIPQGNLPAAEPTTKLDQISFTLLATSLMPDSLAAFTTASLSAALIL
jgi:hypothetical protein